VSSSTAVWLQQPVDEILEAHGDQLTLLYATAAYDMVTPAKWLRPSWNLRATPNSQQGSRMGAVASRCNHRVVWTRLNTCRLMTDLHRQHQMRLNARPSVAQRRDESWQDRPCGQRRRFWGLGVVIPVKICIGGIRVCLSPPKKMSHSFTQNCCWNNSANFTSSTLEDLCQEWKVAPLLSRSREIWKMIYDLWFI